MKDLDHCLTLEQENIMLSETPINPQTTEEADKQEQVPTELIYSNEVKALLIELEALPSSEAKLQRAIQFMEQVLSTGKTPNFKNFWQARDICLQLFKEQIPPAVRSIQWSKYSDLSKEARRLKDLLDEQSAFASEQIDIAIKALEAENEQPALHHSGDSKIALDAKALEKNRDFYLTTQHALNLLNTHASRITALRKELLKTEMRVKKKNQFFQRLSAAGDKVFPQRKELIQKISDQFAKDVENFVATYFGKSVEGAPNFYLRNEIKSLQNVAKLLTLNTSTFMQTRKSLSDCWDKLKELDKERKKERAEQKAVFRENMNLILQKIDALAAQLAENALTPSDADQEAGNIFKEMRRTELSKDEVTILREHLDQVRKPIQDKLRQEEDLRQKAEQDRLEQKKQRFLSLKQEIETFLAESMNLELGQLTEKRDSFLAKIQAAPITKTEKNELEKKVKSLRDLIAEKKELSVMSLSANDRENLQQLRELLKQRKERRKELKDTMEELRRAKGSSGLDFGKAMEYNQQLAEEKEKLEKLDHGIQELEEKIFELEGS